MSDQREDKAIEEVIKEAEEEAAAKLAAKPINAESAVPALEANAKPLSDAELSGATIGGDPEAVDPKVLADQPQPAPPAQPRRLRFTVLCGRKEGENTYRRDIAAVHIMGVDLPEARVNAITLLAANVKDTTVDDWEPIIGYLGHLEIL